MLKKIWALLTGGKVVFVMCYQGSIQELIAYPTGFGKMKAKHMLFIAPAVLESDGTISYPCYLTKWSYK